MNTNENGRTMLEMLGVLAIMGIIIYGAINGINSGITSYKINQIYTDVSTAIKEIPNMYLFLGNNYTGINLNSLKEQNIILQNPFGESLTVEGKCTPSSCPSFKITYTVPNSEICRRLLDMDWTQVSTDYTTDQPENECATAGATRLSFFPK